MIAAAAPARTRQSHGRRSALQVLLEFLRRLVTEVATYTLQYVAADKSGRRNIHKNRSDRAHRAFNSRRNRELRSNRRKSHPLATRAGNHQ
jgi:hypothetical protein